MLLINFSHPLNERQLQWIAERIGQDVERVLEVPTQVDVSSPVADQVRALVDSAGLSPREWQTTPLLIVPPGLSPVACVLLAELHGRCGYFPPVVRIAPNASTVPPVFEVAEIVNLQQVREQARARR
jgi:hypothetical protein